MNIETAFQDLGVNAIVGTEMLDLLGISTAELASPLRFSRLQSVISYFKDLPEDSRRFLIVKATRGKQVNRLDHVFEYVNLLKEKSIYSKDLESTKEQAQKFTFMGDFDNAEVANAKEQFLSKKLAQVDETLRIYEK